MPWEISFVTLEKSYPSSDFAKMTLFPVIGPAFYPVGSFLSTASWIWLSLTSYKMFLLGEKSLSKKLHETKWEVNASFLSGIPLHTNLQRQRLTPYLSSMILQTQAQAYRTALSTWNYKGLLCHLILTKHQGNSMGKDRGLVSLIYLKNLLELKTNLE